MEKEKVFESLENDELASPKSKGMARIRRKEVKNKVELITEKEWFEVLGKNIVKKTLKTNGNKYTKLFCKATKEAISDLKAKGLLK